MKKFKSRMFILQLTLAAILGGLNAFGSTYLQPTRPDAHMTTGHLCNTSNPDFYGFRYQQRIPLCKRHVLTPTKDKIFQQYGVALENKRYYTIDHFVPLSIGGSNDEDNLWPEPKSVKRTRENLEMDIYEAVKKGLLSQEEAIQKIVEAKMNPLLP
ncbi:MAG: HNH endonuclease signature motif containing protein [Bdellovibrionales bacterium]